MAVNWVQSSRWKQTQPYTELNPKDVVAVKQFFN